MAKIKDIGNHPCDCESVKNELDEMKSRLDECKEEKHNQCKEEKAKAFLLISKLEKKLIAFQILAAIAITLMGVELSQKIYDHFTQATEMLEKIQNPIGEKENGSKTESNDFDSIQPEGFRSESK